MQKPTWLIVLPLLGLVGCVYTDGINAPPDLVINSDTPPPIYVGEEVVISAQGTTDPDGDALTYEWSLEWRPLTAASTGDLPTPADCGRSIPPDKLCFRPLAKAIYDVRLTVRDRWGASRSTPRDAPFEVVVNNRPPQASLTVITVGNEFGDYTLGREILLYAGASSDLDNGDVLTFTWDVAEPAASHNLLTQTLDHDLVPTGDATDAVYFRLIPDVKGTYTVTVSVSDGASAESVDVADKDLHVIDDEPPCIVATDPDYATGTLVFDRTETRRLEVTRVTDDLDGYPGSANASFAWSMELTPGSGFTPVVGYHFPYFDLDGADYGLGQLVRVRVRPLDRMEREPPLCPESQQTCGADCFEWITWDIEFR